MRNFQKSFRGGGVEIFLGGVEMFWKGCNFFERGREIFGGRGDVENFQVGLRIFQSKLKFLTKMNCSK